MTKKEFSLAVALAKTNVSLLHHDLGIFDGCGLKGFAPVHCTLEAVAGLIRCQCQYLNGHWDELALNELAHLGRTRFIVVGELSPEARGDLILQALGVPKEE